MSRYVEASFSLFRDTLLSFLLLCQPILVAAAIDYAPKNGNQYGAISDLVRDKAKEQRRIELGIFPPPSPWTPPTSELSREAEHQRWLEGGTILIGRHTFKEYMHGLQRGWTESLVKVDDEEALANRLADDGRFDEIEDPSPSTDDSVPDEQPAPVAPVPTSQFLPPTPTPQSRPPNSLFAPLGGIRQPPKPRQLPPQPPSAAPSIPDHLTQAPHTISPQPPLLLVYYPNRLGFLNIPLIIADFFNERKNVRIGCEAAYKLVMNETRPIIPPSSSDSAVSSSSFVADDPENKDNGEPSSSSSTPVDFAGLHGGDLDFAADSESNYGKSFAKLPASITKARESYYAELPAKLALARSLARNERPPTKDEEAYPPSTEVELRAQRLTKEKRWTGDEAAWKFLRAGSGVAWDERFRDALRVFQTPARSDSAGAGADVAGFEGSTTSSAN